MVDVHNLPPPISSDLTVITSQSQNNSSVDHLLLTTLPVSPFLDDGDRPKNNRNNSPTYDQSQLLGALKLETQNTANNEDCLPNFRPKQCFGSCNQAEVTDADILSAVQFDDKGEYLATGDRGGRVVIFKKGSGKGEVASNGKLVKSTDYKFYAEFLSHEPEFDYLKSLEIDERINQVKWLPKMSRNALYLLSTNEKTIKLWKIRERGRSLVPMMVNTQTSAMVAPIASSSMTSDPVKHVKSLSRTDDEIKSSFQTPRLELPRLKHGKPYVVAAPSRIFAHGFAYHINSIQPSSDGEHFIASDDFRINLQSVDVTDCMYNIVDIKPNLEEYTEIITCSTYLANHSNIFLYSTSKGIIKVCDLRQSTKCTSQAVILKDESRTLTSLPFASEIITSISDFQSTQDGRYIASRDYMTVKLWDTHMNKAPIRTYGVHHHLRGKLKLLYNNGYIFDRFNVGFDGNGSHILTGSYNNVCYIYSVMKDKHTSIQVCKQYSRRLMGEKRLSPLALAAFRNHTEKIDYKKKICNASWHPSEDIIAIGGQNKLFFYGGNRNRRKCP